MFLPKTQKIEELSKKFPNKIESLKRILEKKTNVYIDNANVFYWQEKLGFHIDYKRLKQLLDSFDTVNQVKLYQGELEGDKESKKKIEEFKEFNYVVRTKPVKIMHLPIDVSGIPKNDPSILKNHIDKALLNKFDLETVEYLNGKLSELNRNGFRTIEHLKCNFDVEIASDMLVDSEKDDSIENFVLWSGDSDFADTVDQLNKQGKSTSIFGTARRISVELSNTGTFIFELKKIKEFICWKRELINAKGI